MTYKEIWNIIVKQYNKLSDMPEQQIQKEWEEYFKQFLGYNSFLGEIDSQKSIIIGSSKSVIPDIILKRDGQELFDVELKQYSLSFTTIMEEQLKSYLKQLHISIGILVCQKIYVYSYDFMCNTTQKIEIDFIEDNPDGIMLVELFKKENFSESSVKDFIASKNRFRENVEKIKKEITTENILEMVKLYFGDSYYTDEIDSALNDFLITVNPKKNTIIPPPKRPDPSRRGMDYTQYLFEGNRYGKAKLVLAVVKAYVRDNPSINFSVLSSIFYDRLQGSAGVVKKPEEAKKIRADYECRYFIDSPLYLQDEIVLVCNQWGIGNIGNFIKRANELGYKIDAVGKL